MTASGATTTDSPFFRFASVLLLTLAAAPGAADDAIMERGEYLVAAGGCITCHTAEGQDAEPFAGGLALESPFGTFYSPNITPDPATGIGNWSDEDFLQSLWNGVSPDGEHYFPSFPYTSYTGILREDALAMKAWLFNLQPVERANREHDLGLILSSRVTAGVWKGRYFDAGRFEPDPAKDEQWNRGAYLVRHLGHCGECHTPRSRFGALRNSRELGGNPDGPEGEDVPDISGNREEGIGRWSVRDIAYFLDTGMRPDGDFASGSMASVIDDNTSRLTGDDRRAIAIYLKSLDSAGTE